MAFGRPATTPHRGSEPTFVFTVARRAAVDLWRRGRRAASERSLDLTDARAGPSDTSAAAAAARRGTRRSADRLGGRPRCSTASPPTQREVIDLAYFAQLSQSEIAERLEHPARHRQDPHVRRPQGPPGRAGRAGSPAMTTNRARRRPRALRARTGRLRAGRADPADEPGPRGPSGHCAACRPRAEPSSIPSPCCSTCR